MGIGDFDDRSQAPALLNVSVAFKPNGILNNTIFKVFGMIYKFLLFYISDLLL